RLGFAIHGRNARDHAHALARRAGLDGLLDVPVESLRPLERRLLEIAAALDDSPRALLLDEPTSGLGPRGAIQLLPAFPALTRGGRIRSARRGSARDRGRARRRPEPPPRDAPGTKETGARIDPVPRKGNGRHRSASAGRGGDELRESAARARPVAGGFHGRG